MIRNIRVQGVKSFPKHMPVDVPINSSKRVGLFYGNNGAGKSALGQVIHHNGNGIDPYPNCGLTYSGGQGGYMHLVYNEEFVERNFRNKDAFPGIFSLGEVDADALRESEELLAEQSQLIGRRDEIEGQKAQRRSLEATSFATAQDATWKAYKDHCDGPLDPFLDRMGKSKPSVFEKIKSVVLPDGDVIVGLDELHTRMKDVVSNEPAKIQVNLDIGGIVETEQSPLWTDMVIGSSDSKLAPLIKALGNMDWVHAGAEHAQGEHCPFCQQILPLDFQGELNKLIDTTFRDKVAKIQMLTRDYERRVGEIEKHMEDMFTTEPFAENNSLLREHWAKFLLRLTKNLDLMQAKQRSPGEVFVMPDSRPEMAEVFKQIGETNTRIDSFNERISHRATERNRIEVDFWKRMRHEHGGAVNVHQALLTESARVVGDLDAEQATQKARIETIEARLAQIRANSVGTEQAVESINRRLKRHGITGFTIAKKPGDGNLYCLERSGSGQEDYKSLSEGEKTVIAFFYFVELVSGSTEQENHVAQDRKIIVIDDPVSSLSNTFVYDIAWIIANEIISGEKQVKQILVLTHSLFFHHELAYQIGNLKLQGQVEHYRVVKRDNSVVVSMDPKDIVNEYDAAWAVIKDACNGHGTPIGVANAMRCIFEQFFSFTGQSNKFKNALAALEAKDGTFTPIARYVDNHSHRDQRNLTDFGDHDLNYYLAKFKDVFDATQYAEHYAIKMGGLVNAPQTPDLEPAIPEPA